MTQLHVRACCVLILLPWIAAAGVRDHQPSGASGEVIPGIVIVKFKPGIVPASGSLAKAADPLGVTLARIGVQSLVRTFPNVQPQDNRKVSTQAPVDLSRIYYAAVDGKRDVRETAHRISRLPEVEYAEPKYMQHLLESPNDPNFSTSQNSYFARLNALAGWGIAKGNSNVTIAAVDGGTYWQHEDLSGNLWINSLEDINHNGKFDKGAPPGGDEDGVDQDGDGKVDDVIGWNFTNNTNDPRGVPATPASRAHGTATASHFGAVTNNGIGMAGSSWNCRLIPICTASPLNDTGIEFGYEGIQYAVSRGAQIINCSWGRLGVYSQFERDVVLAAAQAGVLIVAAAGNDTINTDLTPEYPATFPEVFGIGATNSTNDAKAWFSNYGINTSVYAPGTDIWSALDGGGYGNGGGGTSYSSPLVAGLAGIIKSMHPTWTPEQIRAQIRTSADSVDASNPGYAGKMGRGRANFARALSESHAGIQILAASVLTPSGRDFFIPGDTAVVSLIVKNILPREAANLQFDVSSSDPSLQLLSPPVSLASLPSDGEASLPPLLFGVSSVSGNRSATIDVKWVSNGNERDARAYKVFLFSSLPRWLLQLTPVSGSLFSVRAVSPTVAWAAGGDVNPNAPVVVRTTDGGARWIDATGSLSGVVLFCIFAIDELHAWVGSGDGRIFATGDGGTTWAQQPYPGTQSPFIDGIWFFDANNGFALGDPAGAGNRYIILSTTNGGLTWTHLPAEPVAGGGEAGWNNSFWWADPLHGWFGTNAFKVRGTSDGGATWFSGSTNYTSSYGISFKNSQNGVAVFDDGHAMVTLNGGGTWVLPTGPSPGTPLIGVAFAPGTNAVWTSDGLLPYRSDDAGRTWSVQSTFPFTGAILHLSFADSLHGWASTSFGEVLKYRSDTTPLGPQPVTAPAAVALEQNYPNPFNPSTLIRFSVPAATHVTITVYDILGRRVGVIFDGERPAGLYNVQFSSAGLASGVYMYRMEAGDFRATRKMLVLH